jgi:hypothetical protein
VRNTDVSAEPSDRNAAGIAEFVFEMGILKRMRRAGWWHVGVRDPESVAEHSLRVAQLASLIAAQEGDYKVKPEDPGGLKVEGEGDASVAASGGNGGGNSQIAVTKLPEAPVAGTKAASSAKTGPGSSVATTSVAGSRGKLVAPPPGKPIAVANGGGGGALVQLGAFPSEAAANSAWTRESKRFNYIANLGKSVEKAEVNGRTFYRLKVNAGSAGAAQELCGKLKVAGEACIVTS